MGARKRRAPSVTALRVVAQGATGPQVRLLDARRHGLDEGALRAWARGITECVGAPYSARSYRYPYALVAWHSGPVGVDIERIEPCDPAFARSICTPAETDVAAIPGDRDAYFTALWSSKEAIAKALGDALAYDPRRLGAPMLWTAGRAGPWQSAQLAVPDRHVAWICWRDGEDESAAVRAGAPLATLARA